MTDNDFMELVRRAMREDVFAEANSAVIIFYRVDADSVDTYCRGYFDMDDVEKLIECGQESLEDLRNMVAAKKESLQ